MYLNVNLNKNLHVNFASERKFELYMLPPSPLTDDDDDGPGVLLRHGHFSRSAIATT